MPCLSRRAAHSPLASSWTVGAPRSKEPSQCGTVVGVVGCFIYVVQTAASCGVVGRLIACMDGRKDDTVVMLQLTTTGWIDELDC